MKGNSNHKIQVDSSSSAREVATTLLEMRPRLEIIPPPPKHPAPRLHATTTPAASKHHSPRLHHTSSTLQNEPRRYRPRLQSRSPHPNPAPAPQHSASFQSNPEHAMPLHIIPRLLLRPRLSPPLHPPFSAPLGFTATQTTPKLGFNSTRIKAPLGFTSRQCTAKHVSSSAQFPYHERVPAPALGAFLSHTVNTAVLKDGVEYIVRNDPVIEHIQPECQFRLLQVVYVLDG